MEEVERFPPGSPGCPRCAALEKQLQELKALLRKALERIATLEERAGQNSRDSHKPPSQDPPNAPARPGKEPTGHKPGGQLGHEGKNRGLLPPDQVQHFVPYVPIDCERCGAALPEEPGPVDPPPTRHQVAEPTNNHAERLLRKGVLWRKGSFGTWSDAGSRFVERILTVVQTRRLQNLPVLNFLVEAVRANRTGQAAPSLLAA